MKITHLSVERFKSLANVNPPNFANINFLYGYNNSGKSNFLKFIELLFRSKSIQVSETYTDEEGKDRSRMKVVQHTPFWTGYIYDLPFLFTKNSRDTNIVFEVQLELMNGEYPHSEELTKAGYLYTNRSTTPIKIKGEIVSINANDSQIKLKEVRLRDIIIYSEKDGAPKFFEVPANSPLAGNEETFNEVMDIFTDCVMLIESERYFNSELLSQKTPDVFSTSNFKNWLYGLSLDADRFDRFTSLITFLNQFDLTSNVANVLDKNLLSYPFKNTKMNFSRFKEEIEVMLENSVGRFPLKNYGTGIQQLFYILTKIFNSTARIILIEEIELNLSPEYQELIINNLKSFIDNPDNRISQVFFTSHSDYLYRNDFKIYEVSIDENGSTSIEASNYKNFRSMRRAFLKPVPAKKIKPAGGKTPQRRSSH